MLAKYTHTRTILAHISVIAILGQLMLSPPALAFKPNDAGHLGISKDALTGTQRVVSGETLKFSERAIKQIRDANKDTDCLSCQGNASFHFDDEAFAAATSRLSQLRASIITKITAETPDGASARSDLGGALHTLQDFYAHSNWVELGNAGIDTRLGRSVFGGADSSIATCPANAGTLGGAGLTTLTSGWFKIPLCDPPTGKCRHGIPLACSAGLNKDDAGRVGYTAARSLAVDASKDFLNQILDDSRVAGNAKAIKALMDVKSTLGMVIDTTGSMGGIIDQVKVQVAQIVNSVRDTDDAPSQYLLQAFNDPGVPGTVVTQDPDAFLAAVNSLEADGGDDCPELSQTGLLRAVAGSQSDARLYLFTDADSKDSALAGNVIAAAQAKRIQINYALFGSCFGEGKPDPSGGSLIDPAYVQGATQTGGQLFVLDGSEAGLVFNLIKPQLPGNLVPIMSSHALLNSGTRTFDVPIDSTVQSATFSISIENKSSIVLSRPSGAVVQPGDPGVTVTELSSGRLVTVAQPPTGVWHLQVNGSGEYSVQALANSPIQLNSFQFVELTGRPDHEGYFPIAGQPIVNSDQTALATLFGSVNGAEFTLVSDEGSTIQPINLARNDPNAAAEEYVGIVRPPVQSFRVKVTGLDAAGLPYQRIFPALFQAQTLGVTINNANNVPSLTAGSTTRLTFNVKNLGVEDNFQITVADNQGFVSHVEPLMLHLSSGATGSVAVDITVPAGTPEGTSVSLTVTVASNTNPAISNSATTTLLVVHLTPLVQLSAANFDVTEGTRAVTITATRTGDTSGGVAVDYTTGDGSALQRTDYVLGSGVISFAPSETSKAFTLLINDDSYVEGTEQFNVILSNPKAGAVLGSQSAATVSIIDNDTVNPTGSVIDGAQDFVLQHYHDFLSREADPAGAAYWINEITLCGADALCTQQRRIGVSDAFFFEMEYQNTGSWLYRVYLATFGTLPAYNTYMPDRSLIIGGPGLGMKKSDFLDAFTQRQAFLAQYPASMTAAAYVDALNSRTGNSLTQTQRDALVNGLTATPPTETRATVLGKVVDNATFIDREYNRSFVLSLYFGYLRRDAEPGGFDFWLSQINSGGLRDVNKQQALVCSFITSPEYQNRFSSVLTHSNSECPH